MTIGGAPGDGQRPPAVSGHPVSIGEPCSWEPLRHNAGNAATGGVWRVIGSVRSAVVKVSRPPSGTATGSPAWQTSAEPSHWNFWRREALAYGSGVARAYADAGILAPEVLDVVERPDGAVELWLAEVPGSPGMSWPVTRLGRFAYELGVAQAGFVGRVPDLPWLSRDWLAQYVACGPASQVPSGGSIWEHPVAAAWTAADRDAVRRLWARRDTVVARAGLTPRTLCHLDVWPNNLVDDGGRSTLFDWAFVGSGGLGEDVANLIVDSVADGLIATSLLPEIDAAVTSGYLDGLRAGGWRGRPDAVRTAIAVAGAAKYCWFSPAALGRAVRGSYGPSAYGQDRDPDSAMRRLSPLVRLLADWSKTAGV